MIGLVLPGAVQYNFVQPGRAIATGDHRLMRKLQKTLMLIAFVGLAACSLVRPNVETTRAANKYLWNASLDTLSFLPVEQADPFSGLLVTGYGSPPGGSQQYRVTVFLSGAQLDASALRVAVFRRTGGGEVAADAATIAQVEDAILSRARDLRIADARG